MLSILDILAARRFNIEGGWLDVLVPVIIIIVYAVSGILKMRSNMKEQQKTEEAPERPRYRPLDEGAWQQPKGEETDQESARLERMLEVKPMARPEPAVRRPAPARPVQPMAPQERRTLDAFLATQAPKPLAERIAEARAKAEAIAKAQAQQEAAKPLWPRAAERMETALTRKPKVPVPASGAAAASRAQPARTAAPVVPSQSLLGDLTETDTLRRAILYAEILGTPVAFRDMEV